MYPKVLAVIAMAVLMPLLYGCSDPHVKDVRKALGGSGYLRTEEARHHVISLRYTPRLLTLLNRLGVADSVLLSRSALDSLSALYPDGGGMMFVMHLAPRDSSIGPDFHNDVVYGGLSGFDSYRKALHEYSFGLKEKIWAEVGGRKYPLASYQMENSYGMTRGRTFTLVFADMRAEIEKQGGRMDIVLDDIVPGLARRKITWKIPVGKYDNVL